MRVFDLFFLVSMAFSSSALSDNFEFSETDDDFSNSSKLLLSIDSESKGARLLLHCVEGQDLQIQFHSDRGVIFPDRSDSNNARMFLNVMHKFNGAEQAITSDWIMSFMKYYDAWYLGNQTEFIAQNLDSEIFAIKLLKNNDTFRFNLENAKASIRRLKSSCVLT